ncbi:3'(2'),5'-bisphosphate nucleotidase CysQ [archaeon]|jgi:3'(2'), 5'-bisphosphate nucleotidase|nr:3'(2'),5'-bisphosphate nucleotidase CysQ [archaeon]MBT6697616.1 3'(2'),5'-bisphosphate nucleotidase CysQ [archaeon]
MNLDLSKALEIAKSASLQAGLEALKIYYSGEDSKIEDKSDGSPLSKADLKANEIITQIIRETFPNHAILSEEEVDDKKRFLAKYVWIIDPIDGTKEFLDKTGEFTINIALVETATKRPIIAAIYIPVKKELYFAQYNNGAFLESKDEQNKTIKTKLQVSSTNKLENMTLAKSARNSRPLLEKFIKRYPPKTTKSLGSTLKACAIAKGTIDVYLRVCPYSEWDCCAMDLIVNEAGGKVTLLNGKIIEYNQEDVEVPGLLCSNNQIHNEILQKLISLK